MPQKIRKLSDHEARYVALDINAITVCHFTGKLSPELLERLIREELMRQPLLTSVILQEKEEYFFVKADLDFNFIVVENRDHFPVETYVIKALNTKLPWEKRLFEFLFIIDGRADAIFKDTQSTLISIFHHAVSDGISAIEFHKNVIEACRRKLENKPVKIGGSLPIMKSVVEYLPKSVSQEALREFIEDYNDKAENLDVKIIEPAKVPEGAATSAHLLQQNFSQSETLSLLKKCKEHSVSVHGIIGAAHLIALKKIIDPSAEISVICLVSPLDIRTRTEPPISKEPLFLATISYSSCHEVRADQSIWELGKSVEQEIKTHIEDHGIYKDLMTFSETRSTFSLPCALGITNMGIVDIPADEAGLRVDKLYAFFSYQIPMLYTTVVTFNNQLIFNYLFVEPYFKPAVIKELKETATSLLKNEL